jgi:hypothetical protein
MAREEPEKGTAGKDSRSQVTIGVLALQGSFREHMALLVRLPGVRAVEVRQPNVVRRQPE